MTFEEKGNGTTIRLVETVYLYLIQIDFDSKVTEFFHNDLGLGNVGEFVWTESLGRSLGAMEGVDEEIHSLCEALIVSGGAVEE
jgi:hypothetical protein